MKLVLASRNQGKLRELRQFLEGLPVEVVGLDAFADLPLVEETGENFSQNALLKARAACRATGLAALADDSGLCVDALQGAPGVRSARYAGEGAGDAQNNRALLLALKGVPPQQRTGRFVCVLALVFLSGEKKLFEGTCEGRILEAPQGAKGFGYDPLFLDPSTGRSFAELDGPAKLQRSHRGAALRAFRGWLSSGSPEAADP